MFDAIIRSKLLYSLECIQLTRVEQARLDAFQMKNLRRILHIPPTNVDREWTNQKVYQKVNEVLGKPVKRFSEMWKQAKFNLLGHILRCPWGDPMRQVVFEGLTWEPRIIPFRRVGKPREQWIVATMQEAFDIVDNVVPRRQFDSGNLVHQRVLIDAARARVKIFATKPKPDVKNLFVWKP